MTYLFAAAFPVLYAAILLAIILPPIRWVRSRGFAAIIAFAFMIAAAGAWAQTPPNVSLSGNSAGLLTKHYIGAVSTNSTLVAAAPANGQRSVYALNAFNSNATTYYLKLYNKATAPTCGTDVPVNVFALLQNKVVKELNMYGSAYPLGIGFCLVGGIADSDTSNGATGVSIDIVYK